MFSSSLRIGGFAVGDFFGGDIYQYPCKQNLPCEQDYPCIQGYL
jgi:hypothetical protein